jgi:hypothetical protein
MKKGFYVGLDKTNHKQKDFYNPNELYGNSSYIASPTIGTEFMPKDDTNHNAIVMCTATLGDFSNVEISNQYCKIYSGDKSAPEPKSGKCGNISRMILIDGEAEKHGRVLIGDVKLYRSYHPKAVHPLWSSNVGYEGKPFAWVYEFVAGTIRQMTSTEFDESYGDGKYKDLPRNVGGIGYINI